MKKMKRFLQAFLLLSLLAGMVGFAPTSAQAATCYEYYNVRRGDTLKKIADRFNVDWRYLADINNLSNPNRIYTGQVLCVDDGNYNNGGWDDSDSSYNADVRAVAVREDDWVTLEASDLARNTTYEVRLSRYGWSVSDSVRVGYMDSNRQGDARETFDIPDSLRDVARITVRLRRSGNTVAQSWFYNQNKNANSNDDDDNDNLTVSVVRVWPGDRVTLRGTGFPVRTDFNVLMADRQANRTRWYDSDSFRTGSTGTWEETFDIPGQIDDAEQIRVLIESETGRWDVEIWFKNMNKPVVTPVEKDEIQLVPSGMIVVLPTVVNIDKDFTLKFVNLPAGMTFNVLIGKGGTKGRGGTLVGTITSPDGKLITATYAIPDAFKGISDLDVRIENGDRSLTAYTELDNN